MQKTCDLREKQENRVSAFKVLYFCNHIFAVMNKILLKLVSVILVITGLALWTCQTEKDRSVYVAISKYRDTANYHTYRDWLQRIDPSIVLVDMYHTPIDSALLLLEKCSGLLMSGGADVHPAYYGQAEDTVLCEIDFYRDTVEMAVLRKAYELGMPVFGICRGLQVINVFKGGSLYPDIPERFSTSVKHRSEERTFDCFHDVELAENSLLITATGVAKHQVNSFHHQGIDRLAPSLKPTAFSPDTLIEAIENSNTAGKHFMMAVQWHPERLASDSPMSKPLAEKFVSEIRKFHKPTNPSQAVAH